VGQAAFCALAVTSAWAKQGSLALEGEPALDRLKPLNERTVGLHLAIF